MTFIDPDKVEEGNLYAQNYTVKDVGKYKADVLKKRYEEAYNNTHITAYTQYIANFSSLKDIVDLKKFKYLLICADDIGLTLDILEEIFNHYPNIKLTLNGYAVFQQHCCIVDRNNYRFFLEETCTIC